MQDHWLIDLNLFHMINGLAGHTAIDTIIMALNRNSIIRDVILMVPYIFLWVRYPSGQSRSRLVGGLAGGVLAVIVARALAHVLPFGVRPMYDSASGFTPLTTTVPLDMEAWSSFPSDTAAFSIALCLGIFAINRRLSISLTIVAFLVFCLPRIYAGIHYPSDILVGIIVGVLAALATGSPLLTRVWRAPLQLEANYRPWFYAASFVVVAELSQMFDGARGILYVIKSVL